MTLDKTPRYNRTVKKIIKAHKLTKELIEDTENLFVNNPSEPSLNYKTITCKKDKNSHSIRVAKTGYRILMTVLDDVAYLVALLDHDEYQKNNRDC